MRTKEQEMNGAYEEVQANERQTEKDGEGEGNRQYPNEKSGREREREGRSGLICTWLLSKESRLITG